ncbi:uncharacterized protein OCT59_028028 [Rhizophagus irregularis]|uniref:uncharacterized protein n=1 Tax=Rhizophagus irregularis TaxID=588596 RepID=UPI003321FDBE|nr:hypothetical protein OCT59_028028 [Rhizophagus irregularis]
MSTQHNVDDLSQWVSNNFEELEKILHDLIPHIRWFQIPGKVFWRKINQFEPIFQKQLYKDIIGYHIDPDTPPINAILPLRQNDRLIGGYNPLSWHPYNSHVNSNGSWQSTSDSFLFSFTKKEEINSAFLTRVAGDNRCQIYAVCYHLSYGPAFGFGWDLIIDRNNIISTGGKSTYSGVYDMINSGQNHILEDYEVHQVVKNDYK